MSDNPDFRRDRHVAAEVEEALSQAGLHRLPEAPQGQQSTLSRLIALLEADGEDHQEPTFDLHHRGENP